MLQTRHHTYSSKKQVNAQLQSQQPYSPTHAHLRLTSKSTVHLPGAAVISPNAALIGVAVPELTAIGK